MDKKKVEFYLKFNVEQYNTKLGFVSSGMTVSSKDMWNWISTNFVPKKENVITEKDLNAIKNPSPLGLSPNDRKYYIAGWNDAIFTIWQRLNPSNSMDSNRPGTEVE